MDRVSTGIKGFDELVEGGFPRNSSILITGQPGSCKTIFALQYLYNGALKGENGLYVNLDSSLEMLKVQGTQFGWDLEGLEKQGKLFFFDVPLSKRKMAIFDMINDVKKQINAKRVVFDNLATYAINMDLFTLPLGYAGNLASSVELKTSEIEETDAKNAPMTTGSMVSYNADPARRMIYMIIEALERLQTTNLVITYGNPDQNQISVDGVSEFACDGIIQMYNTLVGAKHARTMSVLKMRNTNQSPYIHDMEITKDGLVIKPVEKVYQ